MSFIINPYSFGVASYLFDDYEALVAFSLRQLSASASNCVRVRRLSDSAEQDIGFSGGKIDVASIESFCSGTNGYVAKWYNQGSGGSTYDAVQTTAANQPLIVTSGTIETSSNGFETITFDTAQNYYMSLSSSLSVPQSFSQFFVFDRANLTQAVSFGNRATQTNFTYLWLNSNNVEYSISGSTNYGVLTSSGIDYLRTIIRNSSDSVALFSDGTEDASSPKTATATFTVDSIATWGAVEHKGSFQELIFYSSDETSNRSDIETNINDYYSIF